MHNGVILRAHPVRGESHNQRNTTGEVATELYANVDFIKINYAFLCVPWGDIVANFSDVDLTLENITDIVM